MPIQNGRMQLQLSWEHQLHSPSSLPQGCQMAIATFLDPVRLALRASEIWLRYAALQNLIPSFPWIAPPSPPPWRNPRKGRDQILPSGNTALPPFPDSTARGAFSKTEHALLGNKILVWGIIHPDGLVVEFTLSHLFCETIWFMVPISEGEKSTTRNKPS